MGIDSLSETRAGDFEQGFNGAVNVRSIGGSSRIPSELQWKRLAFGSAFYMV
jgi:hypothetical protein